MEPIKTAQFGQELTTCEYVENPLFDENYDLIANQFQIQLEQSLLRWQEHLSRNLNKKCKGYHTSIYTVGQGSSPCISDEKENSKPK